MPHFNRHQSTFGRFTALGLLIALSCMGCQTPQPARPIIDMSAEAVPPLTLGPGDILDINFFFVPELNNSQAIRPDGFISLDLVGEVRAEGKTPDELKQELIKRYADHLKNPEISVVVRRVKNSKVYVGGEVQRPGFVEMPGRLSVLEALLEAGGALRPTADLEKVVIIRQKNGEHYGGVINCQAALMGQQAASFFLQPRDILFVPPSKITQANDWIDQYINKMIPDLRITWAYPIGPDNAGSIGVDLTPR